MCNVCVIKQLLKSSRKKLWINLIKVIILIHNYTFAGDNKCIGCQHHNGDVINLANDDKNVRNEADDDVDINDEEHDCATDYKNTYRYHGNWVDNGFLGHFNVTGDAKDGDNTDYVIDMKKLIMRMVSIIFWW